MSEQFELFGDPGIKGMVHTDDPSTARVAAQAIKECRTVLHQKVRDAFEEYGEMTDGELEALPQFAQYGPSTIRKRRSELYQAGELWMCGERKNERGFGMMVWRLVT